MMDDDELLVFPSECPRHECRHCGSHYDGSAEIAARAEMFDVAIRYYELLDRGTDGPELGSKLSELLAPYSDNVANNAFVAFLERKRLVLGS